MSVQTLNHAFKLNDAEARNCSELETSHTVVHQLCFHCDNHICSISFDVSFEHVFRLVYSTTTTKIYCFNVLQWWWMICFSTSNYWNRFVIAQNDFRVFLLLHSMPDSRYRVMCQAEVDRFSILALFIFLLVNSLTVL